MQRLSDCIESRPASEKHSVNGVIKHERECAEIALEKREAQAKQPM